MSTQLKPPLPPAPAQEQATYKPANCHSMLDLWQLRHLIALMVRRDLLGQYKGSLMGAFWTIINPLGHLLLYTFVFSVILKVRFGHDGSTGNFALYLMAGLLPWGALAESLNRGTSAVLDQPNLVKRVVFPLEILPISTVISSFISQVVGTVILTIVALCMGYPLRLTLLYLPLVMLVQFLFIGGFTCWTSSLGVYLRDLRHIIGLGLSAWMYASPIVYPASALPKNLHFLLWMNPMAGIVTDCRRVMLEGLPPDWPVFAAYTCLALISWFSGYYFFNKAKRSFADVI